MNGVMIKSVLSGNKIAKMVLPEELMKEMMKGGSIMEGAQFPPNVFQMVPSEFIEYKKGKHLKLRFALKEDYNNPFHITFGGIYGMFFDATFGPFSGLEAEKPTSSLDMNITYLKSTSVQDKYVDITARVVSKSKSYLLIHGEAHKSSGDLVATSTSRMIIMDPSRMAPPPKT